MTNNKNIAELYLSCIVDALQKNSLFKNEVAVLSNHFKDESALIKAENIAIGNASKSNGQDFLKPLFDGLNNKSKGYAFHKQAIKLDKDTFFPTNKTPQYSDDLLQGFKRDLKKLVDTFKDVELLAENLFHLLEKYTVNVPSGYDEAVSLFDFIKVKTAAAICLAQNESKEDFILIGAGISGIQSYLYDIVSKKASDNLKGRSLYLQLLPELILIRLLRDLNLYSPNVLYASGGGFIILAPDTTKNKNKIDELRKTISNGLFEAHETGMYLELAYFETTGEALKTNAKTVFKKLHSKIDGEKRHKFAHQIVQNKNFFEPFEVGGEQVRDAVTNEELSDNETVYNLGDKQRIGKAKEKDKIGDKEVIGDLTKFLMERGDELEEKKLLVIQKTEPNAIEPFKTIDFTFRIKHDVSAKNITTEVVLKSKVYDLRSLEYKFNEGNTNSFRFYGGNELPTVSLYRNGISKNIQRTFSELGGMAEKENRDYVTPFNEPKFKRLGVLRMDVDGLGAVFTEGLASLAQYTTLSRLMDYFFKGYINEIRNSDNFKNDIQIIYAGGDDLFAVGKWDKIIAFSKQIRHHFKEWVCQNETLSISGGIVLVTPKFPIIKAALYAGDAEDEAKEYKMNGIKKNAINLFGESLNWDYEFSVVEALMKYIIKHIQADKKPLPRSFIFKINGYFENSRKPKADLSWHWQIAYDLKRMSDRCRGNNEVQDFLDELIKWSIAGIIPPSVIELTNKHKIDFFRLLNLAVIWASYELRNDK